MANQFGTGEPVDWGTRLLASLWPSFEARRRLGPATRTTDNYEKAWTGLLEGLRSLLGREPTALDVTAELLNLYLSTTAASRGWSEQTVATYGGNIRSVVSGMRKKGLLPRSALFDFELPKVTERVPGVFDDNALAAIFNALERERSVVNLRLRAVGGAMLDCGARPEEIASLCFADLREESSRILISGKGARQRLVPVSNVTWSYLDDYMRVRPRPYDAREQIFLSARTKDPVSSAQLAKDMHDLLVELKLIDPDVKPPAEADGLRLYTLRKTFAQRSADAGMHPVVLAAIMGHSANSLPMVVKTYYRVSPARMSADHALAAVAETFHAYRASHQAQVAAEVRPGLFFGRWAGPASARAGNTPLNAPSSARRTNGAYRAVSSTSSAWPTGA